MSIVSPVTVSGVWEVWLYASPAFRQSVQECGSFRSEGDAVRVGAAVRLWLQLNVWSEDVFGPVFAANPDAEFPDTDRNLLMGLPRSLRDRGIDPARVLVTARRDQDSDTRYTQDVPESVLIENGGCAPDATDDDGDPGATDDAADWTPPAQRGRTDRGASAIGPHTVRVKAERR